MAISKTLATAAVAVLGLGASFAVAACGEDRGEVQVEGGTGTSGTGTAGTATAPVTVDTAATDPAQLDAAMAEVADYARGQTAELVTATQALRKAIDDGDIPAAKRAYAAARPYYERIEPLVALFPELDGKIDAREDDFPKKANDPGWTGFHPIERDLWREDRIAPSTRRLAAGLVTDSQRLDELMADEEVPPAVVIPGVAELVDEVEESKITGEEERYSKLDLPTFLANLEGSRAFYEPLAPLVEAKDPSLNDGIQDAFDEAFAEVEGLKENGRFVAYDELSEGQQRAVKQRIEALAEPLARVQGTLGVGS
jgi:iron uptake system component EfeO